MAPLSPLSANSLDRGDKLVGDTPAIQSAICAVGTGGSAIQTVTSINPALIRSASTSMHQHYFTSTNRRKTTMRDLLCSWGVLGA